MSSLRCVEVVQCCCVAAPFPPRRCSHQTNAGFLCTQGERTTNSIHADASEQRDVRELEEGLVADRGARDALVLAPGVTAGATWSYLL